ITRDTRKYGDQNVLAVDNSFLTMFSYSLLAGDPKTALRDPYTIVITEEAANRYFGVRGADVGTVVGKTLILNSDSIFYKITGVCRSVPENSHLSFDMLASYVTLFSGRYPWKEADYDFTDSDFWHYIQLRHGTDHKTVDAKMEAFSQKYF